MIIKLGILDNNIHFASKFASAFGMRYPNDFEISTFSNLDQLYSSFESSILDVLLISLFFEDELDVSRLPKRCSPAFFVESCGIQKIGDLPAIFKFQKADLIFREILNLSAKKIQDFVIESSGTCRLIGFLSAGCGAGGSTLAASCARHFAMQQQPVLYLNLQRLGSGNVYFTSDCSYTMTDIAYSIKSEKENLSLKLRGCVSKDPSGVCFFSAATNAQHMAEFEFSDIKKLLDELKNVGAYRYVIVDLDPFINPEMIPLYRMFSSLILVCDHSAASISKSSRWYEAVSAIDHNNDFPLSNQISLIMNRTSHEVELPKELSEFKYLGNIEKFHESDPRILLDYISKNEIFEQIS